MLFMGMLYISFPRTTQKPSLVWHLTCQVFETEIHERTKSSKGKVGLLQIATYIIKMFECFKQFKCFNFNFISLLNKTWQSNNFQFFAVKNFQIGKLYCGLLFVLQFFLVRGWYWDTSGRLKRTHTTFLRNKRKLK